MKLESLQLRNIRSYKDEKITFRDGTTLLSGDIGSGKSSILLAIEFTLFGILRGELTGENLLRHGEKEAETVLSFTIEGKDVEVKRTLEKSSGRVQQGKGYVSIDGVAEEGTAQEIKSKVLDILGYPKNLLTKNPDIFRYTVYTPQEDMQKILYEDEEDRLIEIRRIFDLEKYKRVKENANEYAKDLRRRKRMLKDKFDGLDDDKETVKEKKEKKTKKEEKIEDVTKKHAEKKQELENVKEEIEKYELTIDTLNDLEKKHAETKTKKKHTKKEIKQLKKEIEDLDTEEKDEDLDKPDVSLEDAKEKKKECEERLDELRDKKTGIENKKAVLQNKIEDSQELKKEIETLEDCPTCGQTVTEEHKEKVREEENEKIQTWKEKQEKLTSYLEKIKKKQDKLKKKKKRFAEKEEKASEYKTKKKYVEKEKKRREKERKKQKEKQSLLEKKKDEYEDIKDDVEKQKQKIKDLKEEKEKTKDLQKKKENIADTISDLRVEKKGLEKDKNHLEKDIEALQEEIEEKETFKEQHETTRKLEDWMSNHFVNVVDTIEKHVFRQIHEEFNQRFKEWFDILIEEEDVNVRLDDTFTPNIDQNGFETSVDNLSGGEKTSVALAYRLALNKVVNEFLTGIKTENVIILDEPTDGFSTDQLDKVREVIEELDNDQTILVSHEPKLESYVENVINVEKRNHVSKTESY